MKKLIYILLVLSVLSIQKISYSQINTGDIKLDGYDQYVENAMKDWSVQGFAVAIVKKGKVVFAKGYGLRDVKNNLPVTPQTLFAIGSCTKAFTSAAVCMLVDDGKVDFDKPVIEYLPTFRLFDDYVTMHITPRDLLCHRSGLPRHDLVWYGADDLTRKDLFDRLKYLEPNKGFREVWQYQNGMFMVAGYLVEQLSGESWESFVQKKILTPLDMKSTNFSIYDMQKSSDYSKPYAENKDKVIEVPYRNIDAMGPAGSINSNVIDMSNWVIMQLNEGKFNDNTIVSSGTLHQTHSPQMVMPGDMNDEVFYSTYGMGWMITSYRGHLRIEHGGNIDGFSASVCLLPRDSIGIVVLTNMDGTSLTSVVRNYSIDKILELSEIDWSGRLLKDVNKMKEEMKKSEEKKEEVSETTPSHPLKDYAGKFEHPAYGTIEIKNSGDDLSILYHTFDMKLKHIKYDVFETNDDRFPPVKISFITNSKGDIDKIVSKLQDGVKDIEFKRALEKKTVSGSELEKYVGEYEISGVIITVEVRNKTTLMMTVPGQPQYELIPTKDNEFSLKNLDGYSVKFNPATGKITEVVFNQPNGVFTAKEK
jgi:CubicO group peptidase (beta-lactamase class C family)